MNRARLLLIAASLIIGVFCGFSQASTQSYPSKLIRVVVPAAAGGNLDLITRAVMQKLSEALKQSVVVENRPGAALIVGTQYVAKAAPDGYTLLAMANTTVTAPSIVPNAGYDPVKDFTGIGLMARVPMVLVANPDVPAKSVQDLIKLAREHPERLSCATAGGGSSAHIAAELFFQQAGVNVLLVPYKGNAPALGDIVGGRVGFMFDAVTTSAPYMKSGRLRGLAVTGSTRSVLFPELPTVAESGLPGFQTEIFNGLVAPAGTSREIVHQLHEALVKSVAAPDLKERFRAQGVEFATNSTPEEFDKFIRQEVERYAKLAKSANIKAE